MGRSGTNDSGDSTAADCDSRLLAQIEKLSDLLRSHGIEVSVGRSKMSVSLLYLSQGLEGNIEGSGDPVSDAMVRPTMEVLQSHDRIRMHLAHCRKFLYG